MKIRTRLSLTFTFISGLILLLFSAIIYYATVSIHSKDFYSRLEVKANNLLDPKSDIDSALIAQRTHLASSTAEFTIYDKDLKVVFSNDTDSVEQVYSRHLAEYYLKHGSIRNKKDGKYWTVLSKSINEIPYYIVAAGSDSTLSDFQVNLQKAMLWFFLLAILLYYFGSRLLSMIAMRPVKKMALKANVISASNLDLRIPDPGNNDEMTELINTFNEMLDRIENSFHAQRQFVANMSHELRTPLAAIIAELELTTNKEYTVEEYKTATKNALSDAKKLVRLSNNILDLAKASYDPSEISFKQVRVDEILLDARQLVLKANPEYTIEIEYDLNWEPDTELSINGNEYLLQVAFSNLMDNGCKYSNEKTCMVVIGNTQDMTDGERKIIINFSNYGRRLSRIDMAKIFKPFYRGYQDKDIKGSGIGLSLTKRIMSLHKGQILVNSCEKGKTTFTLQLNPSVQK
ncbi:MAG: HAMP domain-containing protein [Saprospiraceae bacterium]|nr:MAG: sensor histidine kinase [Bacteroidetes bacterium OLB9]MCO6462601.1 HAMP domain-containing protein [Saprospiraceae bacterium]MCZ2337547.1 HAMP domain-containing protein [Chitinophagales bacterium]